MAHLSTTFLNHALQPLTTAWGLMRNPSSPRALDVLHRAQVAGAFDRGAVAVARAASVQVDDVYRLLPMVALRATFEQLASAHGRAVEVWSTNQSLLAKFLQQAVGVLVDGYLGTSDLRIGEFLADRAANFVQAERMKGPMEELVAILTTYQNYVLISATFLDSDVTLQKAFRRSRARRLVARTAIVVLLVCIVGAAWAKRAALLHVVEASVGGSPPSGTSTAGEDQAKRLLGQWQGTDGRLYSAQPVDGAAVFSILRPSGPSDRLRAGDVAFSLMGGHEAADILVNAVVRPELPRGVVLDAAAREKCVELWSSVGDSPLIATLTTDRLLVQTVRIELPPGALEITGGKVTGCKPLDVRKGKKAFLSLSRYEP